MTKGQPFSSGSWVVKAGNEDAFVARWTDFTEWSKANAPGAEFFMLIREDADPRKFISFGAWGSSDEVAAWRERPEFQERLAACRELCEDFRSTDHTLSASVGR